MTEQIGYGFEGALLIAGIFALCRLSGGRAAAHRADAAPSAPLEPWGLDETVSVQPRRPETSLYRTLRGMDLGGPGADLIMLVIFVITTVIAVVAIFGLVVRWVPMSPAATAVFQALAFEAGLLAGLAAFHCLYRPVGGNVFSRGAPDLRGGFVTFLVSFPVAIIPGIIWVNALDKLGFKVVEQDIMALFRGLPALWMKIVFVIVATILAPITEELIFRAGVFRYLRGRLPLWPAAVVSALIFGAVHLPGQSGWSSFLPLVMLGLLFALAYERTGRITTSIVAHALFNINSVVMVVLGVNSG